MGCHQTKDGKVPKEYRQVDQGGNGGGRGQNKKDVDPMLPLNDRQVYRLQSSWKEIHRKMEDTGVEMFLKFFQKNDDIKTMFADFKDIPSAYTDAARENEALQGHGKLVLGAIDDVILNLNNSTVALARLDAVGASHNRFAGFTSDLFYRMEEPFLEAVAIILGDRFSDDLNDIYKVIIKYIIVKVSEAYKKGGTGDSSTTTSKVEDRATDKGKCELMNSEMSTEKSQQGHNGTRLNDGVTAGHVNGTVGGNTDDGKGNYI